MYSMVSQSYGRIRTNLGGQVGCVTLTNCLDFDDDPDLIMSLNDSSSLINVARNNIFQNILDEL